MSKKETAQLLASAATDARTRAISAMADQVVAKTREIEAAPDQVAAKLSGLAEALASLSEEAKTALNAVQATALNLPEAYAGKIKKVTVEAEKSITHLMSPLLEIQQKSLEIASYAEEMNRHVRRNMWKIALVAAGLSTAAPTALMFGISRAARIPAWQLIQSTLGL